MDGNNAVLEFQTEMEGIQVNGIDMISFDDEGQGIADEILEKIWDPFFTTKEKNMKANKNRRIPLFCQHPQNKTGKYQTMLHNDSIMNEVIPFRV